MFCAWRVSLHARDNSAKFSVGRLGMSDARLATRMFPGPHREPWLSDPVPVETSKGDQRFRVFMDRGPVLGWMKDQDGRFVFVNGRFEKHIGRSSAEIIGKTISDVMPVEVAKPIDARDREVLRSGRTIEPIEETPSADGAKHVLLVEHRRHDHRILQPEPGNSMSVIWQPRKTN
jgi:PAS domain S-box-containing protein